MESSGKKSKIAVSIKRTPLSKAEVKECRPAVMTMMKELWRGIDYTISLTTADGTPCTIWQETSEEETGRVVDGLLTLGMKSPALAVLLRGTVATERVYGAGSVIAMNTIATAFHYGAHGFVPIIGGGKNGNRA